MTNISEINWHVYLHAELHASFDSKQKAINFAKYLEKKQTCARIVEIIYTSQIYITLNREDWEKK